jgi:hypothetical protein
MKNLRCQELGQKFCSENPQGQGDSSENLQVRGRRRENAKTQKSKKQNVQNRCCGEATSNATATADDHHNRGTAPKGGGT